MHASFFSFFRFFLVASFLALIGVPALADPSGTSRDARGVNIALRETQQQTVIVKAEVAPSEPPPDPEDPAPPEPETPPPPAPPPQRPFQPASRYGLWVFEIGLFGGYMSGGMSRATPDVGEDRVLLSSLSPGQSLSDCSYEGCTYSLRRMGGAVSGVNLFAGFAPSERVHLGGRLLVGPRIGGGALFATGPSVSIHVGGPLWAGASMYLGYASQSGSATITPPPTHTLVDNGSYAMTGSTDVAFGLGFEVRLEMFRTTYGALAIDAHPFFLAGSDGSAFALPLGISYRFR